MRAEELFQRVARDGVHWTQGGTVEIWPDLTWTSRPDMTGSEAPPCLQDAWTATVLAIRELEHEVRNGWCFLLNLTGAPLAEYVLKEAVTPCSGYAGFMERGRLRQSGLRWRPEKWSRYVNAEAGAHLSAIADQHTWAETSTHIVDFYGGMTPVAGGIWPPLMFWPKTRFPKHPRDVQPGSVLLWRSAKSLDIVAQEMAPFVWATVLRAFEIYARNTDSLDLQAEIAGLRQQSGLPFQYCDALAIRPRQD